MQRYIFNTVAARGLSTLFNFFIALLIARHAGPVIKGEVTLLITTIWFFMFFSNILGGQALVYLIPRNKAELLVIPAYLWSLAVALMGFVFLRLTHLVHANHIPSIAILSFLSSLISINQTILLAKEKIRLANLLSLVPLVLQTGGILACFYVYHISDSYAYIYAALMAYIITLGLSIYLTWPLIRFGAFARDFSVLDMRISFRYGLLFQVVEILQLFNLRYYFYQLALQEGSRYLGIYSIGISILEAVWIIPRAVSTVHYVSTSNTDAINKQARQTTQLAKLSLMLCAFALLIIWLIPSTAYVAVFGPGFSDVKHSMRFLLPGILVYSVPLVISSYYLGIGKYAPLIISNLAGFVTLFFCGSWLIPRYVMSGAGLAASVSFMVAALVLIAFFVRERRSAASGVP